MEVRKMRKKMLSKRLGIISVSVLMVLSFGAAYGENPESAEPIKIGALLDFTGVVADLGPRFEAGIKLRLEEANYEVAGRPIQLLLEDGGTDVNISLDKAKKLIERDKVTVMIGPLMGGIQLGLAPYLAEQRVLNFSLINIEFPILEKHNNWIGYPGSTYSAYRTMGYYAYDELGYRTMMTSGSDYAAGYSYLGGVADAFKEGGGKIVDQQWVPLGTLDFNPYLVATKNADAVAIFFASAGAVGRYVTQHRGLGVKVPVIVTDISTGLEEVDTSIILAGLEATGGDASFDKLRPAILGLQIETPQGPTSFTPSGHAVVNRYIFEVKYINGRYVLDPIKMYPNQVDPRD